MDKKIALVTGGTAGIGLATAKQLLKAGYHVVITARNRSKALPEFEVLECDFSSMESIRVAAAEFKRRHQKLHVLVNNAGGLNPSRKLSKDGIELTFAVNHLGYFLLTNLLVDVLKASAPARVVSVASAASNWGRIDFGDLEAERRYLAFEQYGRTKRMNIAFALELAERLKGTGVTSNALHPGAIGTDFGSVQGWFGYVFALGKPFLLTPDQGARTQVWLAKSPDVEGVTGGYFVRRKQARPPRQARDPEVRRKLWEISEQITGLAQEKRATG